MAENILAAACESETRKAAKRMRLEMYQTSQVPACCQLPGAPSAAPQVPRPRVQREQAGRPQAGEVLGWAGRQRSQHKGLADFRKASGLPLETQDGLQPGRNRSNLHGT